MKKSLRILLILCLCSWGYGAEDTLELFIEDIIQTWKLLSPTIVVHGDNLLQMCTKQPWVLCLPSDMDNDEVVTHLEVINRGRTHDGIIFASHGIKELLQQVDRFAPAIFSSNYPIFMSIGYSGFLNLRLDSNIYFFEVVAASSYSIIDKFAIRGGSPISVELAKWSRSKGFEFERSLNRWERRTDLKGAKFYNSFAINGNWAKVIRDKQGNLIDSEGLYQDVLFLVIKSLNLTIITMEPVENNINKLLKNGSWTGNIGRLQRKEADVGSSGLGYNVERFSYVDFPLSDIAKPIPITLLAAIPKASDMNMWVYLRVFGPLQWAIFFSFMIFFVLIMTTMYILDKNIHEESKMKLMGSALGTAYLFTIQLGDHPQLKDFKSKFLLITMSMMTLLMFIYYTSEITAEMTSGPATIPVRRFEDVILHDYKVIAMSSYYVNNLATSHPDSAKHQVYKLYFENGKNLFDNDETAMMEAISDPKTLIFATELKLAGFVSKEISQQLFALRMDDSSNVWGGLAVQKDSEFLGIFNYYMLKAHEHGILKRLHRSYNIDLYVREQFGMGEPQPLTYKNVMFTFMCFGIGMIAALVIAAMEFLAKMWSKK